MNPELESLLDRADELMADLVDEYKECLEAKKVTERAQNLTNEVLEKLRSALDHAMMKAWRKYVFPKLLENDRRRARVYFPIANDLNSFRSILGRGKSHNLAKVCKDLYDFLLNKQPFSSEDNRWLDTLNKIAAEGKHVQLTPQKRMETRRIKVSRPDSGSVSWDQSSVKFGEGVSIMGAPVDPRTQRIVPTPGVTEEAEIWVSFILNDYGVNGMGFCKEGCQKTRALVKEMDDIFHL